MHLAAWRTPGLTADLGLGSVGTTVLKSYGEVLYLDKAKRGEW